MKNFKPLTAARLALALVVGALVVSLAWPMAGGAQDKTSDTDKDLAAQVRELQAKIAKVEAALKQGHKGTPSGTSDTGGMAGMPMGMMGGQKMGQGMMGTGGMEGMKPDEMMGQMMQKMGQMMQMMGQMQGKGMGGGMGMMDMDMMMGGMGGGKKGMGGMEGMERDQMMKMMPMMGGMKGLGGAKPGMMGMEMMGGKGMQMMGDMKYMSEMQMPSALPGFPGASHIYHIGATGFFLDHPDHIKLTTQQQTALSSLKEKALLEKSTSQRKIDETEQELWTLTASDKPDATKIDAKVREIEKLRGDQRLAFIRAVGEAAKMLTDEQRKTLLGEVTPDKTEKAPAHTGH
jgi:hypothetical protein